MLYHKLCIIILILLLLFLYIYVKKENFATTQSQNKTTTTKAAKPISVQLQNEIARVLEISPIRIDSLIYEGDLSFNTLKVSFNILENNITTNLQNEKSQFQAEQEAIDLVSTDKFFVSINNQSIILRKMVPVEILNDKTKFFNNKGLQDISKYANNSYSSVPNDESLIKFYTLEFDHNYKLVPKL
jgi:hypothetical protein